MPRCALYCVRILLTYLLTRHHTLALDLRSALAWPVAVAPSCIGRFGRELSVRCETRIEFEMYGVRDIGTELTIPSTPSTAHPTGRATGSGRRVGFVIHTLMKHCFVKMKTDAHSVRDDRLI